MNIEDILVLDEMPLKEELKKLLSNTYEKVIDSDGFLYAEGSVPVLLVAHLDTVHKSLAPPLCFSKTGRYIMSPHGVGGDDRCGVYMILQIIKELKCHVIFCEQEETGCVGAKKFCKSEIEPDVNYIIEFDRKGYDDAVYYDCDNKSFEDFISTAGFKTQWGSCSDISYIAPYLNVAAVNLSSGYINPHQNHEVIDMECVEKNAKLVLELIKSNPNTKYAYEKKAKYSTYTNNKYFSYSNKRNKDEKKIDDKKAGANVNSDKTPRRGNFIISKMLMLVSHDDYWIYESTYGDCDFKSVKYYIDFKLKTYSEFEGSITPIYGLQVYNKSNLFPPEFKNSDAKLCEINCTSDDF